MEQGQPLPVALASDAAFHFRYQETSELLEHTGMPMCSSSSLVSVSYTHLTLPTKA